MASLIEKYFKDAELQTEFLRAKITATPYDYKISNRVFFVSSEDDFEKYDIFLKEHNTENTLIEALKYRCNVEFFKFIPGLCISREKYEDRYKRADYQTDDHRITFGTFVNYNNLIIRDNWFARLIKPLAYSNLTNLRHDKVLEGSEVWFIKATAQESLIPDLMYFISTLKMDLNYLDNLEFIKEAEASGDAPLFTCEYDQVNDEYLSDIEYLTRYVSPSTDFGLDHNKGISSNSQYANTYKMSVGLSIAYLMELMYTLKDVVDKYPALIDYLQHKPSTFLDMFYTIEGDKLVMNPNLEMCFDKDNTTRFNNFHNYFNTVLGSISFTPIDILFFEMPELISQMLSSMHQHAFQVNRVKFLTYYYNECKTKGIDLASKFTEPIDNDMDLGLPGLGGAGDNSSNELLDLDNASYTGDDKPKDEDSGVLDSTKPKTSGPMLDAADALKHDLLNSKYKFDVNLVKSNPGQQDSYNKVAENIKMLTVNLSKQIKEIKVYNTGGKNNGQSRGKLDKKNLWKYRTDHNIFYNNNYKIKEMDLAFGCILDESGSMGGEKIKNGRIVMILLHEVLNSLGINHSIVGHTSHSYHQCIINRYYQFKEEANYTLQKPYALSAITSKSGNCDSGSLYYMQSVMKHVRNKDKIVIIFSDGQPTECSEGELKQQVRTMEREGIHVIGVGINFESIKEYYPDNANGKNLKEMIDIVVSILKRYVLEKKD